MKKNLSPNPKTNMTPCEKSKYINKKSAKYFNKNIETCTEDNTNEKSNELESNQLESKLKSKDMSIMNLQLRLQFEQMKNKIYANIIQTQTNINIEDIIKESENEIHIFNFEKGNIPLVVHDFMSEKTEQYTIITPKPKRNKYKTNKSDCIKKVKKKPVESETIPSSDIIVEDDDIVDVDECDKSDKSDRSDRSVEEDKKKKKTYRTVKEYIQRSEKELGSKLQEDVARVDKQIDQIVYDNFDVSHKEITESLEKLFDTITKTRVYTVSLSSMKKLRNKLLGKLRLEDYKTLLIDHIKRLDTIFSQRNYAPKKIATIISSSLTPLDMRLSHYEGYTNVNIDADEVHKFGLALEILIEHEKRFVCCDKKEFFSNIKNYGLALFELRECVKRCLVNRYGFQNIIYLASPKSSLKDPYSFYTLEKIKEEKRCWKMECRLEDFSTDFSQDVLPYCISLFRKIYKDVFSDNEYRPDYMSKAQILEEDCEQLIQNIILLAKPMHLCKMFQELITSTSTFTPTESDKFNLYGDDKLQQKKFESSQDSDEDTSQVIKRLFDGISYDDAIKVIESR